ncbi:hypothetical protein GCM10022293_18890 [Azospirillum formosense]
MRDGPKRQLSSLRPGASASQIGHAAGTLLLMEARMYGVILFLTALLTFPAWWPAVRTVLDALLL